MEKVPAEMMREFVRSQNFTSTDEVMTAMKNMFKDILQEVMECELADELGYEKSERTSNNECSNKSKNYRNGYSKKTVKTQLGELNIKVPRDRNGEYEPKIIGKYNRNVDGMEEKILSLYACGSSEWHSIGWEWQGGGWEWQREKLHSKRQEEWLFISVFLFQTTVFK